MEFATNKYEYQEIFSRFFRLMMLHTHVGLMKNKYENVQREFHFSRKKSLWMEYVFKSFRKRFVISAGVHLTIFIVYFAFFIFKMPLGNPTTTGDEIDELTM